MYVTSLFKDKTFLISDLDMIPMNKSYFLNNAKKVKKNQLLIYTADGYGYKEQIRYPMCYNLAYGETYTEILDLNCTFKEFIEKIKKLNFEIEHDWDELYFGKCVREFELKTPERIVKLERGFREGWAHKRIDRHYWNAENYNFNKIKQRYYYDCHLLRPYKDNKKEIDKVLKLLFR
jgi:hypothetical protein